MKEPLGLGMRNQIILSRTSRFVGSLEEEKVSLAWIWMGPMFMLQLERVLKGFMLPSKGSETDQSWSTLPKSMKYAAHSISDQTNAKHDDRFIVLKCVHDNNFHVVCFKIGILLYLVVLTVFKDNFNQLHPFLPVAILRQF